MVTRNELATNDDRPTKGTPDGAAFREIDDAELRAVEGGGKNLYVGNLAAETIKIVMDVQAVLVERDPIRGRVYA